MRLRMRTGLRMHVPTHTGLRMQTAKVDSISYGWPVRTLYPMDSHPATQIPSALNVLPQAAGVVFTYHGDIAADKWL